MVDAEQAQQLKEEGVPIHSVDWTLVEFENGVQFMVRERMAYEKVREQ